MIRVATISDLPAIIELGSQLTLGGRWAITSVDFKSAMSRLLSALRSEREWIGVAEHRGKIVGFMILVAQPMWWNPKQWQVLDDIIYCTRPGMGRGLLKAGIAWAEQLPCDSVEIVISLNSGIETERSSKALQLHGMYVRGVTLAMGLSKQLPLAHEKRRTMIAVAKLRKAKWAA